MVANGVEVGVLANEVKHNGEARGKAGCNDSIKIPNRHQRDPDMAMVSSRQRQKRSQPLMMKGSDLDT